MSRSVIVGLLTGAAVSTGAAAVLSLWVGPPSAPELVAANPALTQSPRAVDALDTATPSPEDVEAPPVPKQIEAASGSKATTPDMTDATASLSRPEVSAGSGQLTIPTPQALQPVDTIASNPEATTPVPAVTSPLEPQSRDAANIAVEAQEPPNHSPIAVETDIAGTALPEIEDSAALTPPTTPQEGATPPRVTGTPALLAEPNRSLVPTITPDSPTPQPTVTAQADVEAPKAEAPSDEEQLALVTPEPEQPARASQVTRPAQVETAPADENVNVITTPAPAPEVPQEDREQTAESEPEADTDTQTRPAVRVVATQNNANRVQIGVPARSLLERQERDASSRLPRLQTAAAEVEASDVAPAATPKDGPALLTNRVPFDNAENKPMLSIVLIDSGQDLSTGPVGLEALAEFPYALTFAIDTSLPDAAERAALYRANGLEVMALVDLPENLTAQDTEIAMSVALDAVPGAVAVMEGPKTGLQGNKDISDQVSAILKDSGHGIVWQPNGLDTAQKLALREGVASETLFRDFDKADQTPVVIRRFLDQAAFKAGQKGGVVMVGRVRPDTISALLVWGLQDRASRVAVAPVSAILSSKTP